MNLTCYFQLIFGIVLYAGVLSKLCLLTRFLFFFFSGAMTHIEKQLSYCLYIDQLGQDKKEGNFSERGTGIKP